MTFQTCIYNLYQEIDREYWGNSEELKNGLIKNPEGNIITQEQAEQEVKKEFIKRLEYEIKEYLKSEKILNKPVVVIFEQPDIKDEDLPF